MTTPTIYRLEELAMLTKPEWLIDGILPRNSTSFIVGSPGSFKTFLALAFGLSIATGRSWHTHPVRVGNVLHIVGEGGSGIRRRATAWMDDQQLPTSQSYRWGCTLTPIDLMADLGDFIVGVQTAFYDGPLELLVIDTLARNHSGDENSSQAMSSLIRQADMLRLKLGCSVMFLHHLNKDGVFRGSTVLEGALDTIINCERDGEQVKVTCSKQKDDEEFKPFLLQRRTVGDSIVLDTAGGEK